jgi:hypothetical protein
LQYHPDQLLAVKSQVSGFRTNVALSAAGMCLSTMMLAAGSCLVDMLLLLLLLLLLYQKAKALGDVLVVGLIPDREILRCKGPPVLDEQERLLLVDAVKWVDEIITGGCPPALVAGAQQQGQRAPSLPAQQL